MAFALWALPSNKKEWITTLLSVTVLFGLAFVVFKFFDIPFWKGIDALGSLTFWIIFVLFWGMIGYAILHWIFSKIFSHTRQ